MRRFAAWLPAALGTVCFVAQILPGPALGQGGPPTIETQPISLSVASGAAATFTVSATGSAPLRYQWVFNGTNLPAATNESLNIPSVQIRDWGNYVVVVSNSLGRATSAVARLTVDADLVFRVLALQTNAAIAIEHNPLTGDDRGGIAVSTSSVFVTGDGNSGSNFDPVTARFPIDTLTGGAGIGRGYDALTSNLRTETVYSLGNGATPVQYTDSVLTPSSVNSLIEIDGTTGQPTGQRVDLSASIPLATSSGIFAGYDRVVLYVNQRVYNIALPSGIVTDLGSIGFISRQSSESWAFWGIAEYFGGAIHLVCVQNSVTAGGITGTAITRTRVPDRNTVPVFGPFSSQSLADMASFTFSVSRSRWFFHHEGTSLFRSGDETVGSAKAAFTTDAGYPAILVEPISQVSYPSSNVTFRVSATGQEPLNYQWRLNGTNIPGATEETLTLTGIETNAMGLYTVEVSNPSGAIISREALLTIYSVPQFVFQPQSRSVFPGTNSTFNVSINAAPPVIYRWRFNGVALANATNSFLTLSNIQPSQAGLYSVAISNRFGGVISANAELNVVVPVDDGSVFQFTSLTTNGARITEVYETLDFNYGYGPLAVSSSRVFYSGFNTMAHNSANDLSGGALNSRAFMAICSDLRTEIVYALGNNVGPFTNTQAGTLTSLWEVNGTSGTLTGNRVSLSASISLASHGSGQLGFFSGYERLVILANARAYNITLPTGFVTDLGPMSVPSHAFSFGGAFWGVAEHARGIDYLVYARNDGQNIVRTRVPDGVTTNLATIPGLSSYMSSITASVPRGRWYFHYLFDSPAFGSGNATVGFANATFTNNSGLRPVRLEWSAIGEAQAVNTAFPVTLTARTASNAVATNYNRTVSLSGLSGTPGTPINISPTSGSGFVNGVWSGQVTVSQTSTSMVLRAIDFLGVAGTSSVFSVNVPNDLVLSVNDTPDPVPAGQRLTYTLTAHNIGPNPATGVTLSNTLSDTVTFVSASSSQGSCTQADRVVQCGIGTVNQGTPVTVTIMVDAGPAGTITNRATVARSEADPTTANNSVVTLTTVTPPMLSIDDVTLVEGNSGTNDMVFTVRLFPPSPSQVTVGFTTLNGTATGGGSSADYVPVSGTLTFPPGITNQTIRVGIRGDLLYELVENFSVALNSPVNAFFEDNQGSGTILNDDTIPSVSVADVSVTERNSGLTNAVFQFRLSTNAGVAVAIAFTTVNGTALDGSDFNGTNGVLTFPSGTLVLSRNVTVPVRGDTNVEPNESFRLVFTVTNATALNTQAVCTILADDGLGVLHHFRWSPIPSPQQLDTSIPVTVTAEDALDSRITNFTGTVAFSGRVAPPSSTVLGDAAFTNSGTGDFTIGYSFVPKSNLTATHFRHYAGTKISLWDASGELLASTPVASNDGTWQETALASPVALISGATYLIAAYTGAGSYYFREDPTTDFTDVNLVAGRFALGDNQPDQDAGLVGWAVDIRYEATGLAQPVAVAPASSGNFIGGVWTGEIRVQAAMTNVVLEATDASQHRGTSTPFDVLVTLGADIAIGLIDSPSPVSIGSNLTYTITVTNRGPMTANGVVVTDSLPGALGIISVTTTTGFATNIGNLVAINLGSLSNRANATISLVVRPNNTGSFTNLAAVTSSTLDLTPGNNQASRATFVYRDTDQDGIWDSWETTYGLNINDATDAVLDPDSDYHSNWQEFVAGTNPTNAVSVTRLVSLELTASGPQLTFQGVSGKNYRLDRRDGPAGIWTEVLTFQISTGGDVAKVIDSMPTTSSVRLYRVEVLP